MTRPAGMPVGTEVPAVEARPMLSRDTLRILAIVVVAGMLLTIVGGALLQLA